MENQIRTGTIINPKSGKTYHTRDAVSAARMIRLLRALEAWKVAHQGDSKPAVQRKVKAIGEVL